MPDEMKELAQAPRVTSLNVLKNVVRGFSLVPPYCTTLKGRTTKKIPLPRRERMKVRVTTVLSGAWSMWAKSDCQVLLYRDCEAFTPCHCEARSAEAIST